MKSLLTAVLLLTPALCLAAPDVANFNHAPDPARQAKMEKRLQTFRTIGLAEALDIDAGQAMALNAQMAQFDARRKPLMEQLKNNKEILERAADGDPAAASLVDQNIQQAFDAHAQIEQIDREMLTTVSKGMSAQQKARLAVFLARFKREMMEHFGKHEGGHGHGKFGGEHEER